MDYQGRSKLFEDVFAPRAGERVLVLYDVPNGKDEDTEAWSDRRQMARDWYDTFRQMSDSNGGYTTVFKEYPATGGHGRDLPDDVLAAARDSNIVVALTEYSGSKALSRITGAEGSITRCASMPTVERRMEDAAMSGDYSKIQKYAGVLADLLTSADFAIASFSTGDALYLDLRSRKALVDDGKCTKPGTIINLPSGEAYLAPYEGVGSELARFGHSLTTGVLPVQYGLAVVRYHVVGNRIVGVIGDGEKAEEMRRYFEERHDRANIAELGIGCNEQANPLIGNVLNDLSFP